MALITNAISALASLILGADDAAGDPTASAEQTSTTCQCIESNITSASISKQCAFTEAPVEIRNCIYEYYFELETTNDLLSGNHPSKDLIPTCKRIHGEAKEIYRHATTLWFQQDFVLQLPRNFMNSTERTQIWRQILDLDDEGIRHMTKVRIFGGRTSIRLTSHGVWAWIGGGRGMCPHEILHVRPDMEDVMIDAKYHPEGFMTCAPTLVVNTSRLSQRKLDLAKDLIGRTCLTKEELIWAVMDAGEDWKGPNELLRVAGAEDEVPL